MNIIPALVFSMDVQLIHESISADAFNSLCRSVGWREVPALNFEVAQQNSLCCVHARSAGNVVGFVRLVGDIGMYLYVQDLIVRADFQGQGIGSKLLREIHRVIEGFQVCRNRVSLIAEDRVVPFYESEGYLESDPPSKFMFKLLKS